MMTTQLKTRAFTLVETLVAIAIVMVVLVAPFHTAEEAINASYISRDEISGDALAQEGIEYIRSIRDNNYLYNQAYPAATVSWLAGLDGTPSAASSGSFTANCFAPSACIVDPVNLTVTTCTSGSCTPYPLDLGSSGYTYPDVYNQAGANAQNISSRFTRTIQMTTLPAGTAPAVATEVKVVSTVTWVTNGNSYTTNLTEYLQNYL